MNIGGYEIQVPFVTTSSDSLKTILEFAGEPGQKAVDLGCGDGRVVLELAKHGFAVSGYEIKEALVERAKQRIREAGLTETAHVFLKDFWTVDLSDFDIVYIYGMSTIMGRLEKKLEEELKPGVKVISNIFRFPHWKIAKEKHHVNLYLLDRVSV
jgi:cyclopropane fatty-acyl-phospholipid synthase-like methyltransferase